MPYTSLDRRQFLSRSLAAGGGLLVACGTSEVPVRDAGPADAGFFDSGVFTDAGFADAGTVDAGAPMCPDPFAGGQSVGQLAFAGEDGVPLDQVLNEGWDGRLYTDLSTLEIDDPIVDNDRFYVRTRYPDLLEPPERWSLSVSGLVTPTTLYLDEMLDDVREMGTFVLECSGNSRGGAFGLMGAAAWAGIPMQRVLDRLDIDPAATRVLVSGFDEHSVPSRNGHSTPGASWIFTFEDLADAGAFLATEMNGAPLPPNHGDPVRLYVPNWYGCCCIKWVDEIQLVDDDAPSTSQMREFASRTHQSGRPELARDFIPATMDQAAMPIRVEKWRVDGELVYRIVGVMWGGYALTDRLAVRFDGGAPQPVDVCPRQSTNDTWTLWTHAWRPSRRGNFDVTCVIEDPAIPTRRLDRGYYRRTITVDEV